jgi:hypothetical protein
MPLTRSGAGGGRATLGVAMHGGLRLAALREGPRTRAGAIGKPANRGDW